MSNIAQIIGGPALVTYKGESFYSKGDITLSINLEAFAIETAIHGTLEERQSNALATVSFVPAGEWEALEVLWPYQTPIPGQSIVRVATLDSVDDVTDVLTVTAHPYRDGAPVRLFGLAGGAVPSGITAGELYYWHALTANTGTLHATEADALAGANPIDITAAGSGTTRIVEQEPLVITTLEGKRITFHVAAVTQQPSIAAASLETLIGSVTFECFRKAGIAPSTADSLYSTADADVADTAFDPSAIITQAYTGAWGAVAPWDSISSRNGFRFDFPVTLAAIEDDAGGIIGRRYVSGGATCTAQPLNIDEATLLAKLTLQGAGAGRGRRLVGDSLNIVGTGVYIRLYGATLRNAPQVFGQGVDRIGDLQWAAARVVTAGVAGPFFYLGTAAPA